MAGKTASGAIALPDALNTGLWVDATYPTFGTGAPCDRWRIELHVQLDLEPMRLRELVTDSLTGRTLRSWGTSRFQPTITRRGFLVSSVATANVLISPARAFPGGSRPEFDSKPDRFSVTWGESKWVVDKKAFDGRPILDISTHDDGFRGLLRRATFATLDLNADLQFDISASPGGEWIFSLDLPALVIHTRTSLREWLSGQQLQSTRPSRRELLSGHAPLHFALSGLPRGIDHHWRLQFDPASTLTIGTRAFGANELSILLCAQDIGAPNVRSQIDARSAKLTKATEWLRAKYSIRANANVDTAMRVRYRGNDDKSRSLVVEPESGSDQTRVMIHTAARGIAEIQLENYRFAELIQNRSVTRTLVGDIAEAGSRLKTRGPRFELSGVGSSARFGAEITKGRLTSLVCSPSARASWMPIEGALTSPFPLTQPHTIQFSVGGSTDGELNPSLQLAQADLTASDVPEFLVPGQGPSLTTGHVVCGGCSDSKPEDLRYFSTHATRPDDLLWLGFEFYNFELKVDSKGKKYLAPLTVSGPALVIVHFPPQHILEDAYNEDLGCAPTPAKLSFPLGAKLSGPSRLVFELPRDEDRLDLTLDALTNWSRWVVKKVPDRLHPRLIRAPAWDETAIELPSRIVSQPADQTHWRTKKYEGQAASRYAVFNAELVPDVLFDPAEPSGVRRARFVPIWTPDFVETGVQPPNTPDGLFMRLRSKLIGLDPFGPRTSGASACAPSSTPDDLQPGQSDPLGDKERREIVRLSHDSTICAEPPAARYLLLSARGAFADVEGFWPKHVRALA